MTTKLEFKYFEGPEKDMLDLCEKEQVCSLCGDKDYAFLLEYAICPELGDDKNEKVGCIKCLKNGRFEFTHITDIGMPLDIGVLDEDGQTRTYNYYKNASNKIPEELLLELKRTPQIATYQEEYWLSHCNDFMKYQGTWEPVDFYKNSLDGDGRTLFMEMTDKEYNNLWDDSIPDGETKLEDWHAEYYVFKCCHCGKLRGNWDCD